MGDSPAVKYSDDKIESTFDYHMTECTRTDSGVRVKPMTKTFEFCTERKVPRTGLMLVGWGGNNGTTLTAGIHANKNNISWETKEGVQRPNYFGSFTQASTVYVGTHNGEEVYVPLKDNVLKGTKQELVEQVRGQIRGFKAANGLDKIVVLWTGNTERFAEIREGLNDTWANLEASIKSDESEISPSTLMCVASILENCAYINGSPQNTFVPGLIELALEKNVFIGGDDFKSGQTKMKSVLVDFLVGAGIKPESIVSYNHLGNNDGKNLSAPACFRSKEISKSNVVDDMVGSNSILYDKGEHPDHVVVIKYLPFVGDSKRAMDEYTSRIFMNGMNTIVMHNTCEDSLLAAPLILDLFVLIEIAQRISLREEGSGDFQTMHPVLSLLSYLTKAPLVPPGTPLVNALFKQRDCMVNIFRACVGLQPDNHMLLEHKLVNA